MPPKNSGGSTKFPGGHKVIHRTAQTAFVRVVTPRILDDITSLNESKVETIQIKRIPILSTNLDVVLWVSGRVTARKRSVAMATRL